MNATPRALVSTLVGAVVLLFATFPCAAAASGSPLRAQAPSETAAGKTVPQGASPAGGDASGWRKPSKVIEELVVASPPPSARLTPQRSMLVLATREALPELEVLARGHQKLAGLRIDAQAYCRQRSTRTTALRLVPLPSGEAIDVPLVPGHYSAPIWSADDRAYALVRRVEGGGELWVADPCEGPPRRVAVAGLRINEVLSNAVRWLPDQRRLLVLAVVPGNAPPRPAAPSGPIVQETRRGVTAQVRTYQDLLQDPHDEDLFEHYGKSRLCIVDPAAGTLDMVGEPRLYSRAAPSPDGTLLLVEYLERPFSYLVPYYRFPRRTVVLGLDGTLRRELHQGRLAEAIPIGGVARGPRRVRWLATGQHALHWTEALDGGDPNVDAPLRDQTFLLLEPDAVPRLWFKSRFRQQSIACTSDGRWVMTSEVDRKSRTERMWLRDLQTVAEPGKLLWERSMQDAYSDPGNAITERTIDGRGVVRSRSGNVFFAGEGAQPSGSRPFVDTLSLAAVGAGGKRDRQRVFESAPQRYERAVGFAADGPSASLVVRSESSKQAPRIELVELATGKRRVLHEQKDPGAEWIANIQKRLVRYEREDGVPMNGTLYLPPSYREGDQLPCLLWAYPREYVNASDAGQVRAAPDRYLRLSGSSHLFMLLEGYAVFDRASMPIVGPRRSANDTFVEQVRMNARAAIAALGAEGCIDTERCAVAGHSYGAFMTANLLAHSDLFCCGIARSGAYNRTLTPFGFQNEERTYWQAPNIYFAMSPFMHAEKVDEPLLLLHGADDNNSGTFPIQSKRFFAAIKGHGGTARLCFLPHESHGYRGRQSVLHCLREMIDWLDLHCKRAR